MIIFKGKDGSVAVMYIVEGADRDKAIKDFHDAHPGMYELHHDGPMRLPDRKHRDAWTISKTGSIIVDKKKVLSLDSSVVVKS